MGVHCKEGTIALKRPRRTSAEADEHARRARVEPRPRAVLLSERKQLLQLPHLEPRGGPVLDLNAEATALDQRRHQLDKVDRLVELHTREEGNGQAALYDRVIISSTALNGRLRTRTHAHGYGTRSQS